MDQLSNMKDVVDAMQSMTSAINAANPFVKYLVIIIAYSLALVVLGLIVYFIYLCIVYYYPRPYFLGHSEPLEKFMTSYIPELIAAIKAADMKEVFEYKSKYKEGNILFPSDVSDDPNSAPFLYLYFALGKDYYKKSVVGISSKLVPGCDLAEELAEKTFYDAVPDEFKEDMSKIGEAIAKLQAKGASVKDSKNPNDLKFMYLGFLVDKKKYIDKIFTMYRFRKSGGLGNMTLLEITMMEYIEYVWVPPQGIVPKIWMNYVKDLDEVVGGFREWLRSPAVNSFVMKLPATIGGVETFDNKSSKEAFAADKNVEEFLLPPHAKPGDTIEEFGFLKGLLQIPKILMTIADFFQTLMAVAMALVNAITNPIAVLRILIGIIVGVLFVILYFVIVALDFLLYIPGAVYVAAVDVWKTIWWVFLFIIQATFYLLIWLLDMVTGGLFLKIMRCENLPSAWYLQPGYFFNNKYLRGFMCNFTCASGYVPNDDGDWCERVRLGRPAYCPQQIIYNAARTVITGIGNSVINNDTPDRKVIYKFMIPPSYYGLDEVSKKTKIVEYLKDKQSYVKKCYKFDKTFAKFAVLGCEYLNAIKNNNPEMYQVYGEMIDKSLKVCMSSHCFTGDTGVPGKALSFCPADSSEIEKEDVKDGTEGKSVAQRVLYSGLALSMLMMTFVALFFYARDKKFDFLKLWIKK